MGERFTIKHLDELEHPWPQWRLARKSLGLASFGMNFAELESLENCRGIGSVSALLLADHGYAPINPPEWIANLRPLVALLSVSARDGDDLPSPETLAALDPGGVSPAA